jgi:tetratricopeptide (TPR) repeat protein
LEVSICQEIVLCNRLDAQAFINMAHALKRSGDLGGSLQSYRRAIILDPTRHEPIVEMGSLQNELKQYSQALNSYENASQIAPTFTPMLINKCVVFETLGLEEDAIATYQKVLQIDQGNYIALFNLAHLYQIGGHIHEAYGLYLKALTIFPEVEATHLNLSAISLFQNDFKKADKFISQSLLLAPDRADAHFNNGVLCQNRRKLEQAVVHYKYALALNPGYSKAWANLGDVFYDLQKSVDSISAYQNALALEPSSAKFHYHLSQALLLDGQFEEGWLEFEWRAKLPGASLNQVLQLTGVEVPHWNGTESLKGKRLLVLSEQGLGDVIQFLRFLKTLHHEGAMLTLMAPPALLSLLTEQSYIHRVIERTNSIADVDLQCSLLSLPFLLGPDRSEILGPAPYIQASHDKAQFWVERMNVFQGARVGLVWSGGFRANQPQTWAVNQRRNIALKDFLSLMTQGCTYFSLQKGELAEQELREIDKGIFENIDFVDFTSEIRDFSDTAAMIAALDLVISVDTSTAHLAAAMGKNVWLLNRYDTCWRWLLNQETSPWYSGMKIFRQKTPEDWKPVLMSVNQKLGEWVKSFDRHK